MLVHKIVQKVLVQLLSQTLLLSLVNYTKVAPLKSMEEMTLM